MMPTKKQLLAERTLEKAVRQMEAVAAGIKRQEAAEAACAASVEPAAEGPAVQVPEYDPLEEDRSPYAANPENRKIYSVICPDCGQLVPSEYNSYASREEADAYAREHCDCHKQPPREDEPPVCLGTCRYCGQSRSVMGCRDQHEADEQATRACKCAGSEGYRDRLAAEERRREALQEVEDNLQSLFDGAGPEQMEIMRLAATAIYDRKLVSISLKLS